MVMKKRKMDDDDDDDDDGDDDDEEEEEDEDGDEEYTLYCSWVFYLGFISVTGTAFKVITELLMSTSMDMGYEDKMNYEMNYE